MIRICSQCAYFLPHGVAKPELPAAPAPGQDTGICALKAGNPGIEKGLYLVEGKQEVCSSFEINPEPGNR
jgi:hypothetical protein